MYQLIIGNKNYSSWSLRPWVLMQELGIAHSEQLLRFGHAPSWDNLRKLSPSGRVPCLIDGGNAVWRRQLDQNPAECAAADDPSLVGSPQRGHARAAAERTAVHGHRPWRAGGEHEDLHPRRSVVLRCCSGHWGLQPT